MCLRMLQPGVTSAIAASQTVRPARIQQSMSSTMFVARDHHQQRRSRTNSPMIGSSVRTAPNAVAALVGLAVVMKTTRTMRALAVATQSGSHALLTVGARVLRIAVAATGDCAPLHTGEPLSQSVGPRPAGGIWGSLCIRCRSSQCSPLRSTPFRTQLPTGGYPPPPALKDAAAVSSCCVSFAAMRIPANSFNSISESRASPQLQLPSAAAPPAA